MSLARLLPIPASILWSQLRQRIATAVVSVFVMIAGFAPARAAAASSSIEYQVKAGFLFNFAKFVEWPPAALSPTADLRLGIIAPDEIYAVIDKALSGKSVGEHRLVIERISASQVTSGASLPNIIFVHQETFRQRQDLGYTQQDLSALAASQSVLLVGESAGFATSGGMIGFVQRGENLRFQVNLADAQRAGLKLSARLSGLAEIVNTSQ